MAAPLVGQRVKIDGLVAKPELNGTEGLALSFDDGKGRYNVQMDATGSSMALKPTALSAVEGQTTEPSVPADSVVAEALMGEVNAAVERSIAMDPVLQAAEAGDAAAMGAALDAAEFGVDTAGEDGDTAMHMGCLYGHLNVVEECLRRGACVNARDEENSTPLHDACAGGHDAIARRLLDSGADPSAVDDDGDSPLHLASNGGHSHVVRLLMERLGESVQSNLGMANKNGETPTDLAEDPALVSMLRICDDDDDDDGVGSRFKKSRAAD